MRQFDQDSHVKFLRLELLELVPAESFAFRVKESIGYTIDSLLDPHDGDAPYSRAEGAFLWLVETNGLNAAHLAVGGSLYDDEGTLISKEESVPIPPSTQLAAYGLWLIEVYMKNAALPLSKVRGADGCPLDFGWTELELLGHQASCVALAYQSLVYAKRLSTGAALNAEEREKAAGIDFAAFGRMGAEIRLAPMKALRKWTVDLYQAGTWKSANQAAHALTEKVLAHGRTIGANLSPQNAQKTIYEWFRKSQGQ